MDWFVSIYRTLHPAKKASGLAVFVTTVVVILIEVTGVLANILGIIQVSWKWFVAAIVLAFILAPIAIYLVNHKIKLEESQVERVKGEIIEGKWLGQLGGKRIYERVDEILKEGSPEAQKVMDYRKSKVSTFNAVEKIVGPSTGESHLAPISGASPARERGRIALSPTLVVGLGNDGAAVSNHLKEIFKGAGGDDSDTAMRYLLLNPVANDSFPEHNIRESDLLSYMKQMNLHPGWDNWLLPSCPGDLQKQRDFAVRIRKNRKYGRFWFAAEKERGGIDRVAGILEQHLRSLNSKRGEKKAREHDVKFTPDLNILVIVPSYDYTASGMFLDVMYLLREKAQGLSINNYTIYGIILLPSILVDERVNIDDPKWASAFALIKEAEEAIHKGEFSNERGEDIKELPCDLCFLVGMGEKEKGLTFDAAISEIGTDLALMLLADGSGAFAKKVVAPGFSAISGSYAHLDWQAVSEYLGGQDAIGVLSYIVKGIKEADKGKKDVGPDGDMKTVSYSHLAAAFLVETWDEMVRSVKSKRGSARKSKKLSDELNGRILEKLETKLINMVANGLGLDNTARFLDALADYSAFWALTLLERYAGANADSETTDLYLTFTVPLEFSNAVLEAAGGYATCYRDTKNRFQYILNTFGGMNESVAGTQEQEIENQVNSTKSYWGVVRNNMDVAALARQFLEKMKCAGDSEELWAELKGICERPYVVKLRDLSVLHLYGNSARKLVNALEGKTHVLWEDSNKIIGIEDNQTVLLIPSGTELVSSSGIVVPIPNPYWASYLKIYHGLTSAGLGLYSRYHDSYYSLPWLSRFFVRSDSPGIDSKDLLSFSFAWGLGLFERVGASGYRWHGRRWVSQTLSDALMYLCCDEQLYEKNIEDIVQRYQQKGDASSHRKLEKLVKRLKETIGSSPIRNEDASVINATICVTERCLERWEECVECVKQFSSGCDFIEPCFTFKLLANEGDDKHV